MAADQGVRYCGACGASNPQGAGYCNKCGQSLVEQGSTVQQTTAPFPSATTPPKSRAQRAFRRRLLTVLAGAVFIVGVSIVSLIQQKSSSSSPSSAPNSTQSSTTGLGTHICTTAHYDPKGLSCTSDDSIITALNKAYLSVTGKDGNNFTTSNLDVLIYKKNSDGTYGQVGSTKAVGGLSYSSYSAEAESLADIFASALAAPESGATYQIEVDEGSTNLGSATFTYAGSSNTSSSNVNGNGASASTTTPTNSGSAAPTGSMHVCTFAHFDQSNNKCLSDDSRIGLMDETAVIVFSDSAMTGRLYAEEKDGTGHWATVGTDSLYL